MAPGVIAKLELWIRGKQKRFVHVCAHPIASHEESRRHIIFDKGIIDPLIEPGGQIRFLTKVECKRDVRFVTIPMRNKTDICVGQRGSNVGSRRFRRGNGGCFWRCGKRKTWCNGSCRAWAGCTRGSD